jgi:hypothetical protein
LGLKLESPGSNFNLSGVNTQLFNIQFRKLGEEKPLDLANAERITNTTLLDCREEVYKVLSQGYEVWISEASKKPLSVKQIEYIVHFEAQNVLEDGYPLIVRNLHDSVFLQINKNVEPFEIDSYAFFRQHVPKGELLETFEPRTARLFESILNKKRK